MIITFFLMVIVMRAFEPIIVIMITLMVIVTAKVMIRRTLIIEMIT